MTTYRELVERTLAVRHASLELGLAKAREQETFIVSVARQLDAARIEYAVKMDRYFNAYFCVNDKDDFHAARRVLSKYDLAADVYCNKPCLSVHSVRRGESGIGCSIVLGADI